MIVTRWKLLISVLILSVVILLILFVLSLRAPRNFPLNAVYTVKSGAGLNSLANDLQEKNIIKSVFWFKVFSVLSSGTQGVQAGDYVLAQTENVRLLAKRFSTGDFKLSQIKVTFPEGLSVREMAKIIARNFSQITENDFIGLAKDKEGYLFPDTYFFLPNSQAKVIMAELEQNFQVKINTLSTEIAASKKSLTDIIKLASIIEEEGRTTETRRIIAGILWRRLALGIPLQVDASFRYINGKTTADLTLDDLKIDSPYNSYLYKGLPPTPICNPGLDSIQATLNPKETNYLYFLTDKNGVMHYAKTHAEHLQNKELYLR